MDTIFNYILSIEGLHDKSIELIQSLAQKYGEQVEIGELIAILLHSAALLSGGLDDKEVDALSKYYKSVTISVEQYLQSKNSNYETKS